MGRRQSSCGTPGSNIYSKISIKVVSKYFLVAVDLARRSTSTPGTARVHASTHPVNGTVDLFLYTKFSSY